MQGCGPIPLLVAMLQHMIIGNRSFACGKGPWAKLLQCVGTACILRTQRPILTRYSPKDTCHLTGCTVK